MRTFDEIEIGKILRHASSLSASEESEPGLGLTVEELHAIGRASGIDPSDIDRAIEELEGASGERRTSWWGGPTRYERTVVVDGEMDADAWERIVTELRSTFHSPGTISTRGTVHEWTSTSGGTSTHHVSVKSEKGRSRIRLFWNNEHNGIPAFIPTLVGSLIAIPVVFDTLQLGVAGIPVWLTIFGMLFMICRFYLDRYVRSKENRIDDLATALERVIHPPETERGILRSGVAASGGKGELELPDPESDEEWISDADSSPTRRQQRN